MTTTLEPPQTTTAPADKMDGVVLQMRPLIDLTDDQFFDFCQQNPDLRIEQTAAGEWIIMPPTGFGTGTRNSELARQLGNWARQDGTGAPADSSTIFILPNGAKRSPDASWVLKSRLATLTPAQIEKFPPLCPDFVVELRSPSDRLKTLQAKMLEYMDNGARLGWLIDTASRRVFIYRPGQDVETLDAPAAVSADPELPGFTLDLAPIWEMDF